MSTKFAVLIENLTPNAFGKIVDIVDETKGATLSVTDTVNDGRQAPTGRRHQRGASRGGKMGPEVELKLLNKKPHMPPRPDSRADQIIQWVCGHMPVDSTIRRTELNERIAVAFPQFPANSTSTVISQMCRRFRMFKQVGGPDTWV